jgi:prevent-host-death family protein
MAWQLQTAKQRFSELVERAQREGPQVVTKHGKEAVVVISADEYRHLKAPIRPRTQAQALKFLLDTDTVSEIRRGRDPSVAAWAASVNPDDLYLSVLTLGEIRNGIERLRLRDPEQASLFDVWLAELSARFAERILPIDGRAAEQWGRLNAGAPRKTVDRLIAATAHVHALTVVTRNVRDYARCDVALLDPWRFA